MALGVKVQSQDNTFCHLEKYGESKALLSAVKQPAYPETNLLFFSELPVPSSILYIGCFVLVIAPVTNLNRMR